MDADQESRDRCVGAVEDRAADRRLDRGKGSGGRGMVLAVDPQGRLAFEHDVELDLSTLALVVLGDLPARADLDQVEAEVGGTQRRARQPPGRVPRTLHRLELVAVLERVAVSHPRLPPCSGLRRPYPAACYSSGTSAPRGLNGRRLT